MKNKTFLVNSPGDHRDITTGNAKVCFNKIKRCWVAPGSQLIKSQEQAQAMASKINTAMQSTKAA